MVVVEWAVRVVSHDYWFLATLANHTVGTRSKLMVVVELVGPVYVQLLASNDLF